MISVTATELGRVMHCFGSLNMPRAVPVDSNREQRDKGNAEHWLAEQMFAESSADPVTGATAPNGVIITDEMIEAVSAYVSALDCGAMEVDTSYAGQGWEVKGRADHVVFRAAGVAPPLSEVRPLSTLTIDDYKSGWRIVEPRMNWTLISHAIGWVIQNETTVDRIVFRIHQPRPFHTEGSLREWSCSYEELMGFYHQINTRLSHPVDELVTGWDHCAKCHALALCPAARTAGMNAIDAASVTFDDSLPKDVLTFELETLRAAVDTIKNRADALDELISHRIKGGEVFEGWDLERRYGHRKWKPGLTAAALSAAAGVDLAKEAIVTPAAAERMGVSKEAVKALTDKPLLDPKLKRIDADAKARAAFGIPGES